jgi:hypothetical protein
LGLTIDPLTPDQDPFSVLLPDGREFHLGGKVVLRFHVIDSPATQRAFRFAKYEYAATFFVPKETSLSSFDAYIGTDIIDKHHLQKLYFFSSSGTTLLTLKKHKPMPASEDNAREEQIQLKDMDRQQEYHDDYARSQQRRAQSGTDPAQPSSSAHAGPSSAGQSGGNSQSLSREEGFTEGNNRTEKHCFCCIIL